MSAKFLHAFADENHQDLHRQIGCMTGIFQMFDRQYLLTSGSRLAAPKRLPSGPALLNSSSVGAERGSSPHIALEKSRSKSWKETQRASLESSTSYSSSSCSSFSSLDCNRSTQQDLPPIDRMLFPEKPLKNSPKLKFTDSDSTAYQSYDIRDVVKDSINRDARGLSIKTSNKEVRGHQFHYKDSPRPVHLPKSQTDLDESPPELVRLKDESWSSNTDSSQPPRLSFDARDPFSRSLTRDSAPRFSYDGREVSSRLRENNNPRLSLDSKEPSLWNPNSDPISNSNVKNVEKVSIVAKLMGLDELPKSSFSDCETIKSGKNQSSQRDGKSVREKSFYSDERAPKTPRKQENRRMKNPDMVMRSVPSSRIPIEPAPWKQQERICHPQKTTNCNREAQVKTQQQEQHVSVYSEIEKRLKDLEFQQSNRDLRALKQILDSMQAKGLLENKKTEHNSASNNSQNKQNPNQTPILTKESGSVREFKSPIVIMKPAKSVSVPLESSPGLPQLRTSDNAVDKKKTSINNRIVKEQTGKASPRVSPNKKSEGKQNPGSNSISTSPRLQQRRSDVDKRSRPPIPNSDSSKTQRQPVSRSSLDSISPRNRLRRKPALAQQTDEQSSDVSVNPLGDELSLRSDSNISISSSNVDMEVTSADKSAQVKGDQCRNSTAISKDKKSLECCNEDICGTELASVTPEHTSPISVLDNSFYRDDVTPPLTKTLSASKCDDRCKVPENQWKRANLPDQKKPANNSTAEFKHKKLESVENLLQKLKQLSPANENEEAGPTTDHIALLCEKPCPDQRYVSEILLASGLLMKDLMEIQLHPSGYPINPDLFLVLEQRKSGWVAKPETRVKSDPQKMHRKVVFDLVNELLFQRLDLRSMVKNLKGRTIPSGQQLMREVCSEIEQLKSEKGSCEDESNVLSAKVVVRESDRWASFGREVSGVVLDIERHIFKELVDEVVTGEVVPGLQVKASRRRRQLFAK